MAKEKNTSSSVKIERKISRPGGSKNYTKAYKGQGR